MSLSNLTSDGSQSQDLISTEDLPNVLSAEDLPNVPSAEVPANVLSAEDLPNILSAEDLPNVLTAEDLPDDSSAEDPPNVSSTEDPPNVTIVRPVSIIDQQKSVCPTACWGDVLEKVNSNKKTFSSISAFGNQSKRRIITSEPVFPMVDGLTIYQPQIRLRKVTFNVNQEIH